MPFAIHHHYESNPKKRRRKNSKKKNHQEYNKHTLPIQKQTHHSQQQVGVLPVTASEPSFGSMEDEEIEMDNINSKTKHLHGTKSWCSNELAMAEQEEEDFTVENGASLNRIPSFHPKQKQIPGKLSMKSSVSLSELRKEHSAISHDTLVVDSSNRESLDMTSLVGQHSDTVNLLGFGSKTSMDQPYSDEGHHTDGESVSTVHHYSSSPKSIWINIKSIYKALLPHILLISNLVLFGGFYLLSPHAMKIFRPIIFGVFRVGIMIICMFPVMLYFDRSYSFRNEKKLRRRKEEYSILVSSKRDSLLYYYYQANYYLFYANPIVDYALRKIPKWKQTKTLTWCGIFIILNQITFLTGYYLTNATVSSSLSPCTSVITCILSMLLGREPKSILKLVGVITSVMGAIAMIILTALLKEKSFTTLIPDTSTIEDPTHYHWNIYHPGQIQSSDSGSIGIGFVLGLLFLLLSTLVNSLYLLTQKKLLNNNVPPITVTFWSFFYGYGVLLFVGCFFLPINFSKVDLMSAVGLIYAGLPFGAVQFIFQTKASSMSTPTIVGLYSTMSPMVGLITGLTFLGEKTSPFVVLGGIFIIMGVIIVIVARYKETHIKKQEELHNTDSESVSSLELPNINSLELVDSEERLNKV
ncbi:predicted protein [Naegleria gruberi]|uniref:Predicted protein n=1 Tax=Naegleria gruberi TaxID=5762 RepID=D2VXZ9_NAEGR|nr:uncharacterized protein NAEGRDRAFT_81648 [Naegleria gruberi]EFC38234.1 predicted protein [Naegleria gruberi]|eukprot:XP_002670978.1 predicted protein [Naegleria gruberi strain NEG-M]